MNAQGESALGAPSGGRRGGQGSCPYLVEAGAAIDGSIGPWRERDHRLTTAGPTDRGVELPGSLAGSGSLGDRPTGRAALGVIGQPLGGEECLFAGREAELLGTIATGQATVLVHPLQTLLGSGCHDRQGPWCRVGGGSATGALIGLRARSARARDPELIAVKIRVPSSPIRPFGDRVRVSRPRRSARRRNSRSESASS